MAAEQAACCDARLFRLVAAHDGIQVTATVGNALLKTNAALSMEETPLGSQSEKRNKCAHARTGINH